MPKYPIKKEFFPWNLFAPPISERFLAMSVPHMKPPKWLWKDKELTVETHKITSFDGEVIDCFVLSPEGLPEQAPCLLYFHGGGFVLEAAGYHYKLCKGSLLPRGLSHLSAGARASSPRVF